MILIELILAILAMGAFAIFGYFGLAGPGQFLRARNSEDRITGGLKTLLAVACLFLSAWLMGISDGLR